MHHNAVLVNPDDVLVHPSNWTEVDKPTAALRSALVPVVEVYSIHGHRHTHLIGHGWRHERSRHYLNEPGTRFFTQVGCKYSNAAISAVPAQMDLSKAGADFIGRGYENPAQKGYDAKAGKYYAYDDGYGYPTIGYGHLILAGEDFKQGLTAAQVQQLFVTDASDKIKLVNRALTVGVSQNQFDALVSLTFNIGGRSRPIRILNAGGAVKAHDFTTYDHVTQNGKKVVSKGLLTRRKAEWTIFSKNVYNASH